MKNLKWMRALLLFIGLNGAFSVLFGAWFTHAGQALSAADITRIEIAQFYQFIHTVALFVTTLFLMKSPSKLILSSCLSFSLGILCFSGSLYVKTFFGATLIGTAIAKVAPIGGILLAVGWLCLMFIGKQTIEQLIKNKENNQ